MKQRITNSTFQQQVKQLMLTFVFTMGFLAMGYTQIVISFQTPSGWTGPIGIHYFNETLSGGTLPASDDSSWPANLTEMDCDGTGFCTFLFPSNVTSIDIVIVAKGGGGQTADITGITASTYFDGEANATAPPATALDASSEGLPSLDGADLYWVYKGRGSYSSPVALAGTESDGAVGPVYESPSLYVEGGSTTGLPPGHPTGTSIFGARTYGAGPTTVPGPGLGCNNNDTSFGMNLQCPDATNTAIRVNDGSGWLKSDVTQGCPFIQSQEFGVYGGGGGDGSGSDNLEGIAYAVYTNDCNGTKVANENFPASSTQVRRIQLKEWTNTNPVSGVSGGSTAGTEAHIGKESTINFLDDGVGNGCGIGGDEARFLVIGGNSGSSSTWNITSSFDLRVDVDGNFGLANEVLIANHQQNNGAYTQNDAGSGNVYSPESGGAPVEWVAQGGAGYRGERTITNPRENGETLTLDFTSTATVTIQRTAGSADGRATIGPGMGGKANLVTEYDKWCVVELTTPLPAELIAFTAKLSGRVVDLAWTTASESNTSHFEIERSFDGQRFQVIGKEDAAGFSTDARDYYFQDATIASGIPTAYYRLKTIDLDGTYEYSQIRTVRIQSARKAVSVSPNPNIGIFQVFVANFNNNARLSVFNSVGQLVYSRNIENNENSVEVDVVTYPKGLYIVKVEDGLEAASAKVIVK